MGDRPRSVTEDRLPSDVGDIIARHGSLSEASSLASIDRPPSERELPAPKLYALLSFPVLALLAPASVFGTLARLGLDALTTYPGQSVFSLVYAQTIGCFIMGFALGMREPLGEFYGPLYTALTTGFCGSLTTFSGWQYDVFSSWDNAGQDHRNWLRDVVDGITKTVVTAGLAVAALGLGTHLSTKIRKRLPPLNLPPPSIRYGITTIAVLIYAATIPAYFALRADYRHQATAALLFSYPGTLGRYLLSVFLNPRSKALPLGTLAANVIGTALLGVFHVLQNMPSARSLNACALLQGLLDGYCGCLTTVSTFAAELVALEERKAWRYLLISWTAGQLVLLVILGPSFWAGDVGEQRKCSFA